MVRDADLIDVEKIAYVHVESWKSTYRGLMPQNYIEAQTFALRQQLWRKIIENQLANVLVVESQSRVIGFACFGQPKHLKETNHYELSSIYFLSEYSNQGYGSQLYLECEKRLMKLNAESVTLWALDSNKAALHFYKKHGFQETGEVGKERLENLVLNDLQLAKHFSKYTQADKALNPAS